MHFQVPCGWGWASILGLVHESISHAWNLCKVWDDALQELSWTMTGPGSQASQAPKARLRVIFYNFWGIWNPGTHLRNPSEEPIWFSPVRLKMGDTLRRAPSSTSSSRSSPTPERGRADPCRWVAGGRDPRMGFLGLLTESDCGLPSVFFLDGQKLPEFVLLVKVDYSIL